MAICNIDDLRPAMPEGSRLIGLDLGERTIGMALSDSAFTVASPIGTIRRAGKFGPDADALLAVIEEREVGGIVLGLPRNMDGSLGPRAQATRQFAYNLLKRREMPIVLWDERLSTVAAERAMIREADLSRAKRAKRIDQTAAAIILQGALERLRGLPEAGR